MITIDGKSLTLQEVVSISRNHEQVSLHCDCFARIKQSAENVLQIQHSENPAYGINTGFGIFANKKISSSESNKLNRNLILSHAIGTGTPFSEEIVRAAMLIRANSLAKGFSGVRMVIIETILKMLNSGLTPWVRNKGSLGSSGDLCMLSQLALVFTRDEHDSEEDSGMAEFGGQFMSGKMAMQKAGIPRIELNAKEGLAIINGATFSAAIAALACFDAEFCLQTANASAALSLESILGRSAAFDPRIHQARGLAGQIRVAGEVRVQIQGSSLIDSGKQIQDPYSFRCIPQVHGPIMETLDNVQEVVKKEINAATDNPLIFSNDVLSGGNFHGEPIAMNMDFLAIAMTELSAIAERRIFLLLDEHQNNGLPPMLAGSHEQAGLNSGVMIPQYTAASLVLENRILATPDSIQSLPTSANQEDLNANALTAARHADEIVKNTIFVIALEMFVAARAVDLRKLKDPKIRLGEGTEKVYQKIRIVSPFDMNDKLWDRDIQYLYQGLLQQKIIEHKLM
jgi:histidine ammonia-lyase